MSVIDHYYQVDSNDIVNFRDASEMMRQSVAALAFHAINAPQQYDTSDFDRYVRSMLASTYHQSASCPMSPNPTQGVVGSALKVHCNVGLFLANSSVFADNIMYNTNLICFVISEKVADRLKVLS